MPEWFWVWLMRGVIWLAAAWLVGRVAGEAIHYGNPSDEEPMS